MKKALVIGLGVSGRSAVDFLTRKGFDVSTYDDKLCPKEYDVALFDRVVVSPGVPRSHFLYQQALEKKVEVIGEAELALRGIDKPVLAVTGTNGKTTTTMMVEHVLNYFDKKVCLLGNGGVPLTSEFDADILVVELSSFQLETMQSRSLSAACILNITPDHLDRYQTMEEYAAAKMRIARCMKPDGHLYVEQKTIDHYGYLLKGFSAIGMAYSMAASALCSEAGITHEQYTEAIKTFKRPPHRIEFVRKIHGIAYINDSKGTNVDAVSHCVETLHGQSVLIVGGVDKGSSYQPWTTAFAGKVKALVTIGEASEKIEQELKGYLPIHSCLDLQEAVHVASSLAGRDENVVLSPGCSSFDMFKNYTHRGDEFKRIVRSLGE